MKIILTVITCVSLWNVSAQNIKVYHEKAEGGYKIYADNEEYCAVSVKISFSLSNLLSTRGNDRIFVLPPRSRGRNITDLEPINERIGTSFNYRTKYAFGNTGKKPKKDYPYTLPYAPDSTYVLVQGYNGSFSHSNEAALDFSMPTGSGIHAARDGVVYAVVDDNDGNCTTSLCAKMNNYVRIYHKDGTMASYEHIKKEGALVNIGDKVKQGQLIAQSGNVGFSTAPHLHFDITTLYKSGLKRLKIASKFVVEDLQDPELLVEKVGYKRKY